ncbi:histidine kinase [Kitasatospora sp. NPDC048540]|uniref:sensor histidine kinase n=1 Tax=unclassified Kitasatospora TaxID=2633591 RepID=UPI0006913BBC|nr:histidine kinase [Kitasatospora sp. MBT63]
MGAGGRTLPGWATGRCTALLLPVLLAGVDAALVGKDGTWWELMLSAVACLALLMRRRYPVLTLLLTLPGTYVEYIWIAPITAVYSVAAHRAEIRATTVCATLFALVEYFHWPVTASMFEISRETALDAIESVMLAAAPAALGLLARTRRELAERIVELTEGQQRESRLLAERVLGQERARLAREMHDVVSHQVSLISIQAGALQVSTTDPAAKDTARTIRELSVRTLEELRQMVGVLRAASLRRDEPLAPQPRLADLPKLIEGSGLPVTARLATGDRDWPEAVERAAYRTVQEALTNIRKHAPGAPVSVSLAARGTRLLVEVRNGPAPLGAPDALPDHLPGGGHGLVGLRERAQLLGGSLTADPGPDGGFTVRAELPAAGGE